LFLAFSDWSLKELLLSAKINQVAILLETAFFIALPIHVLHNFMLYMLALRAHGAMVSLMEMVLVVIIALVVSVYIYIFDKHIFNTLYLCLNSIFKMVRDEMRIVQFMFFFVEFLDPYSVMIDCAMYDEGNPIMDWLLVDIEEEMEDDIENMLRLVFMFHMSLPYFGLLIHI
ncbi:hypothetical protein ACJX0J_033620, partial [Zea mays]